MDVQGKNGLDIRNQQEKKATGMMSSFSWDLKNIKKRRSVLVTGCF